MRGGGSDGVEDLAARGRTAHVVIPDSFTELTAANRANRVGDAAAPETGEPLLGTLGATVRGPAFLSGRAGTAARVICRRFCAFFGDAGWGPDRVVGFALF